MTAPQEWVREMNETVEAGRQSIEIASTASSDWVYKAEGKAHIVFGYRGKVSAFTCRVLRIRKSGAVAVCEQTQVMWKNVLLPQIIPERLLVEGSPVDLRLDWLQNLLRQAESARPEWRLAEASEQGDASTMACLLQDLTCATGCSPGQVVLSVEIKVFRPIKLIVII